MSAARFKSRDDYFGKHSGLAERVIATKASAKPARRRGVESAIPGALLRVHFCKTVDRFEIEGRGRYRKGEYPLDDALRSHLNGEATVLVNPLSAAGETAFSVVRFDLSGEMDLPFSKARQYADELQNFGIPGLIEVAEGGKGHYHFWVFHEEPVPAWPFSEALIGLGRRLFGVVLETVPSVRGEEYIPLPLQGESVLLQRRVFVNAVGKMIKDQGNVLQSLEYSPRSRTEAFIAEMERSARPSAPARPAVPVPPASPKPLAVPAPIPASPSAAAAAPIIETPAAKPVHAPARPPEKPPVSPAAMIPVPEAVPVQPAVRMPEPQIVQPDPEPEIPASSIPEPVLSETDPAEVPSPEPFEASIPEAESVPEEETIPETEIVESAASDPAAPVADVPEENSEPVEMPESAAMPVVSAEESPDAPECAAMEESVSPSDPRAVLSVVIPDPIPATPSHSAAPADQSVPVIAPEPTPKIEFVESIPAPSVLTLLVFERNGVRFALEAGETDRILSAAGIIPSAVPGGVCGTMEWKEKAVTVLDPAILTGRGASALPARGRVILLGGRFDGYGLLADTATGTRTVSAEAVTPPGGEPHIRGIVADPGAERVLLIDAERMTGSRGAAPHRGEPAAGRTKMPGLYVLFSLADRQFGIPAGAVREIIPGGTPSKARTFPYRGEELRLIDLRLNDEGRAAPAAVPARRGRILVLGDTDARAGLAVETVGAVRDIAADSILSAAEGVSAGLPVTGVARFGEVGPPVLLLDPRRVLEPVS